MVQASSLQQGGFYILGQRQTRAARPYRSPPLLPEHTNSETPLLP